MHIFFRKIITKIFFGFIFIILILGFCPINIHAQTLTEIEQQMQAVKAQKAQREKELASAQALLSSLKNQSYSVSMDITTLQNQITDIENKINEVKTQIADLEKNIADTQASIDKSNEIRKEEIKNFFIDTYTDSPLDSIFAEAQDLENFQATSAIKSYSIDIKKKQLDALSDKYSQLTEEKAQVEDLKKQLDEQESQLNQKKKELQDKLTYISQNINSTANNASNIKTQLGGLNSTLSYLDAQHQKLLDAELAKMAANQQTQQTPVLAGQYFFMGRGRDLYDGHGMGMSQWGAYNAAQAGWTYDQILRFYYTNVTIGDYAEPAMIVVDGKTSGPIPFDNYLAGIGEVPNSWPTETIKAQVVAARTYAMRSAYVGSDGYYHICGTDACQVYNGGTGKMAAVQATKGKVILYNGSPIVAYYSANHRGCSSTLPTVWGSADKPYIQTVKDNFSNGFMVPNAYNTSQLVDSTNWQWRTNGYSISDLTNILSRDSRTNVGTLQSIELTKDTCGRVANIKLIGSGGTKNLTGWDFRAIFNNITPYNDYVYSTEFSFYQK